MAAAHGHFYVMNYKKQLILLSSITVLSACTVGPDYKRPTLTVPTQFKEADNSVWKKATPSDLNNRGQWWTAFHSKQLNALEKTLTSQDQNIQTAKGQYEQSVALVAQARAAYFPTVSGVGSWNYQAGGSGNGAGAGTANSSIGTNGGNNNFQSFGLSASWEGDLWGSVRRNVEAANATAEASRAQMAATTLSDQASLAQYYFELQGVDDDQVYLDKIVQKDQRLVDIANAKFSQGVFSLNDVILAKNTLDTAKQAAANNKINRALYEHAIAVLLGKPPADFSIKPTFVIFHPPKIPAVLPSSLLERRPDVAQAERNVIAANAQIGVAKAAYFPVLSFTPWAGWTATNLASFSSAPLFSWSIGPQIAETLLDGGLRRANYDYAKAGYRVTVSQYRQAVLTAFQNVEDALAQLRSLNAQEKIALHEQHNANLQYQLTHHQLNYGDAAAPDLDNASITALNADKNASDVAALQMTYTVALIKAIGGGYCARSK